SRRDPWAGGFRGTTIELEDKALPAGECPFHPIRREFVACSTRHTRECAQVPHVERAGRSFAPNGPIQGDQVTSTTRPVREQRRWRSPGRHDLDGIFCHASPSARGWRELGLDQHGHAGASWSATLLLETRQRVWGEQGSPAPADGGCYLVGRDVLEGSERA